MAQGDSLNFVEITPENPPNMNLIRVALDVPLSTLFDYKVDDAMQLAIGQCVVVPFGRKEVVGIAMEWAAQSELDVARIKSVVRVLDDVPPLPSETLALLRFCSDYYHYPLGMTALSALPSRLRDVEPIALKQSVVYTLSAVGQALDIESLPKRRVVQQRILLALRQATMTGTQLRELSASAPATLKLLIEAGWVEMARTPNPLPLAGEDAIEKNNFQSSPRLKNSRGPRIPSMRCNSRAKSSSPSAKFRCSLFTINTGASA